MIDWQGNKVMEGDMIIFVCIRAGNAPILMAYDDKTNRLTPLKFMLIGHEHFAWRPYLEALVVTFEGILSMDVPGPSPGTMMRTPIEYIWELNTDPDVIFCIKEKSDDEEVFFNNYFKPSMN